MGLGTGLHTFILYLGPHIAAVTMAAYECGTTDFPSPPYPDSIICPDENPEAKKAATEAAVMSIWAIMSKVRIEAFCWGAGTALGELPPYFMARAHRLSGYDPDEEEDEFVELQEKLANQEEMVRFFIDFAIFILNFWAIFLGSSKYKNSKYFGTYFKFEFFCSV